MSSRQARRERREAERKAKKAEMKRAKAAIALIDATAVSSQPKTPATLSVPQNAPSLRPVDESATLSAPKTQAKTGFVSQTAAKPVEEHRFVSHARAEINRANAQRSTGPRTSDGKLASSRNSLKHGLASGTLIIPGEDSTAFETLRNTLLEGHRPATETEELLVNEMAQSWWLTHRAIRLQNECFTQDGVDGKRLSLFLRYQITYDRAFFRALNALTRLQKERRKTENRFVSQNTQFVRQNEPETTPSAGFVSQDHPKTTPNPLANTRAA